MLLDLGSKSGMNGRARRISMRIYHRLLVLSLIAAALLGMAATPKGADDAKTGKFYVVEMYDFYFDPPGLLLQPGDRVAWIMLADTLKDGHSATAYHPANDKVLRIPDGAGAWSTPLIKEFFGWSEYTFQAVGVHDYFCIPHETEGMVGRVIVAEATGPGADATDNGISAAGKSSIPTTDEIMGNGGLIFGAQAEINAVVFQVRENTPQDARDALDALTAEVNAGKGQSKSLYEALKKVDELQPFLDGLSALGDLLAPSHSLDDINKKAEELKLLLDEAYQKLLATSGSGA